MEKRAHVTAYDFLQPSELVSAAAEPHVHRRCRLSRVFEGLQPLFGGGDRFERRLKRTWRGVIALGRDEQIVRPDGGRRGRAGQQRQNGQKTQDQSRKKRKPAFAAVLAANAGFLSYKT